MNILKTLAAIIKVISTIFISSAIGWELWNIYALMNNISIPSSLNFIFWWERFAITAHLIAAVIAGFYAPTKEKRPMKYAIYTFFVGTVSLIELFAHEENSSKKPTYLNDL
ncbi:hypothetical protein [Umezakia ovalisporum]|uniref:Uncharacterized protein n=2 Tax=Umezakia ovalisporum TaxID=75695 RepID=A0AA43KFU2_9CYAN|nr:hypothetical protein [Umezakia ovalisporum]MDH6055563.1 hypothetical protein [Umezakia ovalisporum FSS-43]MDH6065219.1 hypothetical protein [Umezakia ovalisporum FSS-62]MDH6067068.1 hypothetical protein [Umezakia ovalisporum APH033B]MDH6070079.1 hypothetical protein [Umezakia ovalisporum CobakiLakeA]MDH6073242.1 hypothetical protein [Umezakia ovalisporum CS-1034]